MPAPTASPASGPAASSPRIPLRFEPCIPATCGSAGEWSYIGLGGQYTVLVGAKRIAFLRPGAKGEKARMTTLEFAGAAADAKIVAGDRLQSEASYFRGSDPKQWRSHVPDYGSVSLLGIYAGIDLRFYENARQLEFDIQAQPGADLSQLRLRSTGDALQVLPNGDLNVGDGDAAFSVHIPAAYQVDTDNHRLPVAAGFIAASKGEVALRTGQLQSSLPTVVDPTVAFSTYLAPAGGIEFTYPENIAVDGSGNIWVAGADFAPLPEVSTNPQLNCSACGDYAGVAFAAKFSPSGNLLVTVSLGVTTDMNVGMALDRNGNVYMDGTTEWNADFPTTPGAFDTGKTAYNTKMFVSKVDPSGSILVFSTLLGGNSGYTAGYPSQQFSLAGSIQVDGSGDAFVGGTSSSPDFPVTANAFQTNCGEDLCTAIPIPFTGGFSNYSTGILSEFSPDGSKLLYSTFLGGSGSPGCTGNCASTGVSQIALESGNVLLTGQTLASNFPIYRKALHPTLGECGGTLADFLASIDLSQPGRQGLAFSTFICEPVQGIAADSIGDVYLGVSSVGETIDVAPTAGTFAPIADGFGFGPGVEEISSDGTELLNLSWLSLGRPVTNPDYSPGCGCLPFFYDAYAQLNSLALDSQDNVYVSGQVRVDTMGIPIVNAVQTSLGTGTECNIAQQAGRCSGIFIVKLDPQLDAPIFSTVFGPTGDLPGEPYWGLVAVDKSGDVYATGTTSQAAWPTSAGAFQPQFVSGQEGFVLKITGVPSNPGVLLNTDHLFFGQVSYGSPVVETVTIVNHGSSPLKITSIKGSGSTDPLSASQNCIGTVAVDASCSVAVTFNPQAAGDLTGTITIADSSAAGTHVITGIGEGLTGVGSPAATSLNFLPTPLGQTVTQTLLFSNTGNLSLNVSSIVATGAFSESDDCAGGISPGPGNGCAIYVSFTPTQAKNYTGTLTITDNGPGSPHVVQLAGSGPGPAAVLSTPILTFGGETLGSTTAAQTVTLSNPGQDKLVFTSIVANGDFTQTNNCQGGVKAGAKCTISVKFSPTAPGSRSTNLLIRDNAYVSPQGVWLSGEGLAVSLSPVSLTFPNTVLGSKTTLEVKLTNKGKSVLILSGTGWGIEVTGANANSYSQTNTCGASVAAGASCTIAVTFEPTRDGTLASSLTIRDSAYGEPQNVPLSGTGTGLVISLSKTALTFPSTKVGSAAAPQTFTLTNKANATLNLSGGGLGFAITGTNVHSFSETNTCGASLAPGAKCTITVTFKPVVKGMLTADVSINSNAYPGTQTVALNGAGE
jgi:hypothetical protein